MYVPVIIFVLIPAD